MHLLLAMLLMIQPFNTDLIRARDWIISQQNENGGWSDGLSERSGPGITVDALMALGDDMPENAPAEYLRDFANQNATVLRPVLAAKLTIAAVLLGDNPRDFANLDLLDIMLTTDAEYFGDSVYEHCLILIAASHTDVDVPAGAINFVGEQQNADGSWGFTIDAPPDSSTTALCLQATIAFGGSDVRAALDYLRDTQNDDSGWPFQNPSAFSTATDAYSTAQVIMALNAAEQNLADWGHPEERLRAFQRSDGAIAADDDPIPLLATSAAILALSGRSLLDISP
jgi:hypothetical protein